MKIQSGVLALLAVCLGGLALAQQPAPASAPSTISKAALDTLTGNWLGPVAAGAATLTFVAKFKVDANGVLQGSLSVPEQGGTPLPMSEIRFADNKLTFKIPVVSGEYTATYADGALTGLWRQGEPLAPPEGVPVVLKRGEYVAPSHALTMSADSFALLAGTWNGTLNIDAPQGPVTLPIVMRFETDKRGDRVAFVDSPSQGASGIAVTEASLSAGKLFVRVETLQFEYSATLSGNSLTGWTQGAGAGPLTMTRK
jgi:hypothetical protein